VKGDTVRNIVFEEENIILPTDVIGIESIPTSDIAYDTIQNNVDGDPPREQTLAPQEVVPLRRSTRERRSALPDDYIAYLQEHASSTSREWIDTEKDEFEHIVMEDDPINFHQAMESANSQQWLEAMNEQMQSMKDNDVWDLVALPEGIKPIGNKWIFKPKRIQVAMWRDLKLVW